MNKKDLLLGLLSFFALINQATNNVITISIKEYPKVELPTSLQGSGGARYSQPLEQPTFSQKKHTYSGKKHTDNILGLWALYKGYSQASNFLGQITFPRKQQSNSIQLIISQKITPVFIVGPSTIGYWQIDSNQSAAMYTIEIVYDEDANSYYFITKRANLPDNNQIPLNAIVILGDPNSVYIPEGATITEYTANLTLPDIYIKPTFDFEYNAFYTLSLKNYFAQITTQAEYNDLNIAKLMNAN